MSMMSETIMSQYPMLFGIVGAEKLSADLGLIDGLRTEADQSSVFKTKFYEQFKEGGFEHGELIYALAQPYPEFATGDAAALEAQLATIVQVVGIEKARSAYKEKLLTNDSDTFLDARYEIAVAATGCRVLDTGSVELEKPIPDKKKRPKDYKNTDVYGTFHGQAVRIEVTVIHEELPPPIHLELDEYVEEAAIGGFSLKLRRILDTQPDADRVRRLMEQLHSHHTRQGPSTTEIDHVRFEWRGGAYHCDQPESQIESIQFYDADYFLGADECKEIIHPCSVRRITPRYIQEDYPNPPGVVTIADVPGIPVREPVSKKVHDTLTRKLAQCADDTVNIVAFGNPLAMHDLEIEDAVCGPTMVTIPFTEDANGVRHMGRSFTQREARAPFVPADCLASDQDRQEFIKPFRILSAVWHIRVGANGNSKLLLNPNATVPVPSDLISAFPDGAKLGR